MKKFFLLFFLSINCLCLEWGEKINTTVEKILPENVIVMSKGKSDHVKGFDQVKIYRDGKFVARGLSVGAGRYRAGWKIFRVVDPSAFKVGNKLSLEFVQAQDVAWEYIDKPISHYRQIVIDFYPSINYTRVNEGDFSKVESKVLFKGNE